MARNLTTPYRGRPISDKAVPLSSNSSYTVAVPLQLLTDLKAALEPFLEMMELTTGSDDVITMDYSDTGYGFSIQLKQAHFDRLKELSERLEKLCP